MIKLYRERRRRRKKSSKIEQEREHLERICIYSCDDDKRIDIDEFSIDC